MNTAESTIPRLRDGERLSRDEYERRYTPMHDVKADLLDGVVYVYWMVTADRASARAALGGWICYYKAFTPLVEVGNNCTIRFPGDCEPQPNVSLWLSEDLGGQVHIDEDDFLASAPELIGEVMKSSLSHFRTVKMPIYRREGVREFILWDVDEKTLDWYILRNGDYVELPVGADGIIRSETFPGLWLDLEAMIRGDGESVFNTLKRGVASPEHADFTALLQSRKATHKSDTPHYIS